MMSKKLINNFFNVDWYVLMHVKQSQTRETFIAHIRPKTSFITLEPMHWKTFLHYKRLQEEYREQLGYLGKIQRFLVMLREKKEVQMNHGPSLQFSTSCTRCGSHSWVKKRLVDPLSCSHRYEGKAENMTVAHCNKGHLKGHHSPVSASNLFLLVTQWWKVCMYVNLV